MPEVTISTHILNTTSGRPLPNAPVTISDLTVPATLMESSTTNSDGRLPQPFRVQIGEGELRTLKLRFEFADADKSLGVFYPFAEVAFTVSGADRHLHVPLLISPYGYSTYRGS
ncbi:hypothetical protein HDU83_007774 [Entophlyctis luteolus]|nr:hypothetical protein HDU83_007774 [Entophlyctis luteolus]KAJ3387710.1 hypothetical protein HDU84_000589 [Entophlyctis sp. JEL0112]